MTIALTVIGTIVGLLVLAVLVDLAHATSTLLRSIACHRNAQASSVLHHAGLLDTETAD